MNGCLWFIHKGPVSITDNALTARIGLQTATCGNCGEAWDHDPRDNLGGKA